jgi:hypothetical protein
MKALGAVAELKGTASLEQHYWGLAGKLSAMADDGKALLEAFGIPLPTAQGQALNVSLLLAPKDGALNLIDIAAVAGGRNISGSGELTREGRVQLDLETDVLSVNDALALAFMPWRGAPTDLEQRFAAPADTPFAGEIFLKPKLLELPFGGQATEAVVGLGFDSAAHNLNIVVPGDDALSVDMKLEQKGDGAAVTGSARVPYDLAALFREADGKALASGTLLLKGDFKSTGSSPAAALAALEGKGIFWLGKSKLERVTLTGFKEAVLGVTTPEALSRALDALDQPPGSEVGQRIGNFEITNGETLFSNFAPDVAGIAANLQPKYDAVANQLQLAASFAITDRPELPPVTVNYVGTPGTMVVRNGTSALAAKLGYELLSTEMAKLEKLQQEEAALLAKEEKQRVDDQQRFDDYQQTRIELREQSRMRKFHAAQRERSAAQLKATLDEALKIGDALNKADLLKQARVRQVRKPSL